MAWPVDTVKSLIKLVNRAELTRSLTCHAAPTPLDTEKPDTEITGGSEAKLKTVEGDMLTVEPAAST